MSMRLFLIASCLSALAVPAAAQTSGAREVQWGGELTVASAYVWRGEPELRTANLQPDLWFSAGAFTFSSWMALEGSGVYEHDAGIEYGHSIGSLDLRAGWTNYFVPSADGARLTNDVVAGVEYDGPISPSLSFWQGVGAERDSYLEAAVSTRIERRHATFEPRVAAGYLREPDAAARLSHIEYSLTVEWTTGAIAVRPFITHVSGIREGVASRTYGGLAVGLHR
jgi:hypothetical protein